MKEVLLLFNYALFKKVLPYFVAALFLIFVATAFGAWLKEKTLIRQNTRVLERYKNILEEATILRESIKREKNNTVLLEERQKSQELKIASLKKELKPWQKKYWVSLQEEVDDKGAILEQKEKITKFPYYKF